MPYRSYYVEPYKGINRIVGVVEKIPHLSSLAVTGNNIVQATTLAEYDLGFPHTPCAEIYLLCKEPLQNSYTIQVSDSLTISVVDATRFLSNNMPEWMVSICLTALQQSK